MQILLMLWNSQRPHPITPKHLPQKPSGISQLSARLPVTTHLCGILAALAGSTSGGLSATRPPDQSEAQPETQREECCHCMWAPQHPTIALVMPTPDQPQAEKPLPESDLLDFFANFRNFVRTGMPPSQTEPKPVFRPGLLMPLTSSMKENPQLRAAAEELRKCGVKVGDAMHNSGTAKHAGFGEEEARKARQQLRLAKASKEGCITERVVADPKPHAEQERRLPCMPIAAARALTATQGGKPDLAQVQRAARGISGVGEPRGSCTDILNTFLFQRIHKL
ncbi:hypothetical protein EI94DRAFT_1702450 [Lactarius quietus]|nr:hypothetical protein EI94DRAFT_1702450 [Lactarius quietus]